MALKNSLYAECFLNCFFVAFAEKMLLNKIISEYYYLRSTLQTSTEAPLSII